MRLAPATRYACVSRIISCGVPARSSPRISSRVEKIPLAGLGQLEFLLASSIRPLIFTYLSAISLLLAMLVKGITPTVVMGCAALGESSRRYAMRFLKVESVIRAGSHPSPNSTTRRQAAAVDPPHQIGIGFLGSGFSSTSRKS